MTMSQAGHGLIGRTAEIEHLRRFLVVAADTGAALQVSGDPGLGKTVLLEAAAAMAKEAGALVLTAAAVSFETSMRLSTLNQLFSPMRELLRLNAGKDQEISAALGLSPGDSPDPGALFDMVSDLLRSTATDGPVLLIVDDLCFVDRTSAAVLQAIAESPTPGVGLLAATRSEVSGPLDEWGVPHWELEPLEPLASARLLDLHHPDLDPRRRGRLLAEAAGNPLALIELPAALSHSQLTGAEALPVFLPLTARLVGYFVAQVKELPKASREILLFAALEPTGDVDLFAAAGEFDVSDFEVAERSRLIFKDHASRRWVFQHPFVRSTVIEVSTAAERRRAHAALAAVLDARESRAWHRAEATGEPDEDIARDLSIAGWRFLFGGDAVTAVNALLRAAALTPDAHDKARRIAEAAYLGAEITGDLDRVPGMLADARRISPQHPGSVQAVVTAAHLLLNGDGDIDTAHRLLVTALNADHPGDAAQLTTLIEWVDTLQLVCFFGGREELWPPFLDAVDWLGHKMPDALAICAQVFPDPARTTVAALGRLDAAIDDLDLVREPTPIVRIATGAFYVDRLRGCRSALQRVADDGMKGGAVASAASALTLLGFDEFGAGNWDQAKRLADEALTLREPLGYHLLAWPARYLQALLSAVRGDASETARQAEDMSRWAAPRGAGTIDHYACHVRGLAALGSGDFEQAYQQASAVSPAGALAPHVASALWVALDLVEAAVRTQRHEAARSHVAALRRAGVSMLSSRIALLVAGSEGLVADSRSYSNHFEAALGLDEAGRWPFDLARIRLVYGERLRRDRSMARSRVQLNAALETFERLGAVRWAARARAELRATGLTKSSGGSLALTPQERQVAELAAAGLTNKQIAERLFISHRTVGAHLHQVFPKLGITSRAALRDALDSPPVSEPHP